MGLSSSLTLHYPGFMDRQGMREKGSEGMSGSMTYGLSPHVLKLRPCFVHSGRAPLHMTF